MAPDCSPEIGARAIVGGLSPSDVSTAGVVLPVAGGLWVSVGVYDFNLVIGFNCDIDFGFLVLCQFLEFGAKVSCSFVCC